MPDNKPVRSIRTWEDLDTMFNGLNERARAVAEQRPKTFLAIDEKVEKLRVGIDDMLVSHEKRLANISIALQKPQAPQ